MNSRHTLIPMVQGAAGGFTLMEILVAIFIFALLITTIFGSFRAVFSSADAVGGDVAVFSSARTCLGRMATDLSALYVLTTPAMPSRRSMTRKIPIAWWEMRPTWPAAASAACSSHPWHTCPSTGIHGRASGRIVYYADQLPDDSLVLRRADHLYPFPEFRGERGRSHPVRRHAGSWNSYTWMPTVRPSDRWDSESADNDYATPRAVEIRLTMGAGIRPDDF
jgi:general secretion pathway protein J